MTPALRAASSPSKIIIEAKEISEDSDVTRVIACVTNPAKAAVKNICPPTIMCSLISQCVAISSTVYIIPPTGERNAEENPAAQPNITTLLLMKPSNFTLVPEHQ